MKKAWRIIANIAKWAALVLLGLFAFRQIWNYVDTKHGSHHPLFGRKDTVIVTGSMSFVTSKNAEELKDYHNQIQVNDVIVTSNKITYDSLNVYDVILFRTSKGDICHRIIQKYVDENGRQMLVTRGDANEISDGAIEYTCVIGKVVKIKPKLGYIVSFLNSPYFLLGISIAVGCTCVGIFIANRDKKTKEPNEKQEENKQENAQ